MKEQKLTLCQMKALSPDKQKELFDEIHGARSIGKTVNYASVYGAAAETVSRSGDIPLKQAKEGLEAYWRLNWSVKAIAEEQCVVVCDKGLKWLVNPVNGFLYNVRKDSDRFSTLCQGTGSFFFDMWIDNILTSMDNTFGVKRLCGSFHDEYITRFKDSPRNREIMERITRDSINKVSEDYKLRRVLGCDVQFGKKYSDIH